MISLRRSNARASSTPSHKTTHRFELLPSTLRLRHFEHGGLQRCGITTFWRERNASGAQKAAHLHQDLDGMHTAFTDDLDRGFDAVAEQLSVLVHRAFLAAAGWRFWRSRRESRHARARATAVTASHRPKAVTAQRLPI